MQVNSLLFFGAVLVTTALKTGIAACSALDCAQQRPYHRIVKEAWLQPNKGLLLTEERNSNCRTTSKPRRFLFPVPAPASYAVGQHASPVLKSSY
jgi:hypothetical protein